MLAVSGRGLANIPITANVDFLLSDWLQPG